MLRNTLLLVLFTLMSYFSFAQQVEVRSNFWGTKITHDQKTISVKDFVELTKSNQKAYDFALKAKQNKTASDIFSTIGGLMIGWPLGTALAGGEFKSEILYAGLGIACISIPFASGMSKNLRKAGDAFNGKTVADNIEYSVIANANGIGLSLNF